MSDLTCPECGYNNKPKSNYCAKCGTDLDRTITNRHEVEQTYNVSDETTVIPESFFAQIEAVEKVKEEETKTEAQQTQEDDNVETPVETLKVATDTQDMLETGLGQSKVVGDLILTHKPTNSVFRIPQEQLDEVVIGRKQRKPLYTPTVDLSVIGGHNQGVSRRHATLMRKRAYMVIVDHHSKNGTFLNGLRITPEQPRVIRDNDTIRLGLVFLLVQYQTE